MSAVKRLLWENELTVETHHVFLEEPSEATFARTMRTLRTWLDQNEVEPLGFRYSATSSGAIVVELTFGNRRQASLFERTFCNADRP
jgi:hypothetical protein